LNKIRILGKIARFLVFLYWCRLWVSVAGLYIYSKIHNAQWAIEHLSKLGFFDGIWYGFVIGLGMFLILKPLKRKIDEWEFYD